MGPVLPADVTPANKTNKCLVHQGGRLQQVSRPLTAKVSVRESAQLRLDERNQLLEGCGIPFSPCDE